MKKILLFLFCFNTFQVFSQLSPVYDSIPMRDGKKLAMLGGGIVRVRPDGTILIQTPYNRLVFNLGLPLNVGININAFAYNVVVVDWRGFFGSSAAAYIGAPTQSEDGYDVVEWIATQSWSDGQVGTWGPSALGRVQFMTAKAKPPHLVCMVPLVAGPQQAYKEYYPGGVLRTEYVDQLDALGFGTSPAVIANPVHNALWTYVENQNFYPDSIQVPTFMIGGWYDHNIESMLEFFTAIRATATGVQNQHRLLMGPWVHGGHGAAMVGSATQGQLSYPNAADWNDSLALMFYDYHLRGISNGWDVTPFIQYYQMGENNWKNSAVWPPTGMSNIDLYLQQDGSLTSGVPVSASASLNVVYNPLDASPTVGGSTLRADMDQGPYDQAPDVESRSDILGFTTPVLGQDVIMKGKARVHLKISSNKKDTDFAIRLTDVYPDGRSMLVNDGITRMRFRNGFAAADTSHMTPGTVYDVEVELPSTCITFVAGHRIRVDVSSSNYPKYNRNDNSSGVMYPGGNSDSLANPQTATNTIYVNNTHFSYIRLPLIDFVGSVGEKQTDVETYIFPNPSHLTTQLNVTFNEAGVFNIGITDIGGRLIYSETKSFITGKNTAALDGTRFPPGIYLVHLSGNKSDKVFKWVVE